MILFSVARISRQTEEIRHSDVTTGIKCVWNVITADYYSFCSIILLLLFFVACTGAGPWGALEVQTQIQK